MANNFSGTIEQMSITSDQTVYGADDAKRNSGRTGHAQDGTPEVKIRVSEKGCVSVYGLGRFPVSLYRDQWLRLLQEADGIRAFIQEHEASLPSRSHQPF